MRSHVDKMRAKNSGSFFDGGPERQISIFTMLLEGNRGKHQFLRWLVRVQPEQTHRAHWAHLAQHADLESIPPHQLLEIIKNGAFSQAILNELEAFGFSGIPGLPAGKSGLPGFPPRLAGLTGRTGRAGLTGLTGLTEPTGPTGRTGLTGLTEHTGLTEPTGPAGLTGLTELTGLTGLTRPIGPAKLPGPAETIGLNRLTCLTWLTELAHRAHQARRSLIRRSVYVETPSGAAAIANYQFLQWFVKVCSENLNIYGGW